MASSNNPFSAYRITTKPVVHKESGSCFDTTKRLSYKSSGSIDLASPPLPADGAFSSNRPVARPSPSQFLCKGTGVGGHSGVEARNAIVKSRPPKSERRKSKPISMVERPNPPNTEFRKFYERGDLPILVDHRSGGNSLAWKVDIKKLDYHHYLPIFFDGLREIEPPYSFMAQAGAKDMIMHADQDKVLPVIPQLIMPIKLALNTRQANVIATILKILDLLVKHCGGEDPANNLVGQALVPYYRQILPVLNIFMNCNANIGDSIDYSQRKESNLGDLINYSLEMFETYGGEDAFINIKISDTKPGAMEGFCSRLSIENFRNSGLAASIRRLVPISVES